MLKNQVVASTRLALNDKSNMITLNNLFGSSPFSPLASHMKKVSEAITLLKKIFEKGIDINELSKQISKIEHEADIIKNEIRNKLPKSIFLPISKYSILEMLSIQNTI